MPINVKQYNLAFAFDDSASLSRYILFLYAYNIYIRTPVDLSMASCTSLKTTGSENTNECSHIYIHSPMIINNTIINSP